MQLCILSFLQDSTVTVRNRAGEKGGLHPWTEWVVSYDPEDRRYRLVHAQHFGGKDWVNQLRTAGGATLQQWIDSALRACRNRHPKDFEHATLQAIDRCGVHV